MPTLTEVVRTRDVAGIRRRNIYQYSGPASYATGGDAVTPEDVGLGEIEGPTGLGIAINAGGTIRGLVYDHTNEKILWYVLNTGAEVAATTDLSGFSAYIEFVGR